jgi:hypothetical protein
MQSISIEVLAGDMSYKCNKHVCFESNSRGGLNACAEALRISIYVKADEVVVSLLFNFLEM